MVFMFFLVIKGGWSQLPDSKHNMNTYVEKFFARAENIEQMTQFFMIFLQEIGK